MALLLLPTQSKQALTSSHDLRKSSLLPERKSSRRKQQPAQLVARLFGPTIFKEAKLHVHFLMGKEEEEERRLPRAYTLTHSDVTSQLTLAVARTVNRAQLQGWYHRVQRDEVVAEWKEVQGHMSLHVHCHVSGGHVLLNLVARLRYNIFNRELPVVLKAFVHGDWGLFERHPELEEALVWVYFHSDVPEFNRVECWGPLRDAATALRRDKVGGLERPRWCGDQCDCYFPARSLIPWPHDLEEDERGSFGSSEISSLKEGDNIDAPVGWRSLGWNIPTQLQQRSEAKHNNIRVV